MFTLCLAPISCTPTGHDTTVASYCLLLPGKTLHISALLTAKKLGNKEGAVRAIHLLESAGLGEGGRNKTTKWSYNGMSMQ